MPATTMHDILHPTQAGQNADFPNAPSGWNLQEAKDIAASAGLELDEVHLEVIRVLQGCYAEDQNPPVRRLCDALAAVFKPRGGSKLLYKHFPGGPIAQGCVVAGLTPPPGVSSGSFGSVQ